MNLVLALQNMASNWLTILATVFNFFGQLPFFVLIFAFIYLNIGKSASFKFWLTYVIGFVLGSLLLKNIISRQRPYEANKSLLAVRNSYSGSMPSASAILVAENSSFIYFSTTKNKRKTQKIFLFLSLFILCTLTCLSQIYFAKNYLLDVLIGLIIGWLASLIIYKYVNIKNYKKIFYICFPLLIISLLFFVNSLFTNDFTYSAILEFIGISSSILFGLFVEEKYIKYKVKNNFIFTSFKLFFTLIILVAYYYICNQLLTGILFYSFLKYFMAGLIVTILLPLLFKKMQKYFYIFSKDVDVSKVVLSKISFSEKGTSKIAKEVLSLISKGETVLLSGDLGAGKSVLVRNILKTAGVNKAITSPTFVIVNKYQTENSEFYHFDMYRIEDEEEIVNIGFEEIIDNNNAIKFIEWPEKAGKFLPKNYKKITITKLGKTTRNIILEDYQN